MIFLVIKTNLSLGEILRRDRRIKLERQELRDGYLYAWTTDDNLSAVLDWFSSETDLLWFRHIPDSEIEAFPVNQG